MTTALFPSDDLHDRPRDRAITTEICRAFELQSRPYQKIEHLVRTYIHEQSAQARVSSGGPLVLGIKSLLTKETVSGEVKFHLFVLPGHFRLDNYLLREHFPDWKNFRYCTLRELNERGRVVLPTALPPFGKPLLGVDFVHFDAGLIGRDDHVGFYAGSHSSSIIAHIRDLIAVVQPDDVFHFSKLAARTNDDL